MRRNELRGWRANALIVFILIALLEGAEWIGNLFGFGALGEYAAFGGLSLEQEFYRLISLTIFAVAISIGAALTAYGLYRNKSWLVMSGTITGIILFLYGGYQFLSANVALKENQTTVMLAGASYILMGFLAIWLVRQVKSSQA